MPSKGPIVLQGGNGTGSSPIRLYAQTAIIVGRGAERDPLRQGRIFGSSDEIPSDEIVTRGMKQPA